MADKRISQLVERVDIANNDVVPIVASGATTTNKATISSIQTFMQENLDVGVTSVGITIGTSGTDVSVTGSPVTTSGNITINIPTASATNRGLLSAADWITFNSKQDAGSFVTLNTTQTITAQKTFTTSGSSDTMIISHGSGSGFALDVLKAGNNEALRVTKTSGSGNAMTVIGGNFEAPTIVKTGGTSSQFLKADGSVDSNTYLTTGSATSTYVPYSGAAASVNLGVYSITANAINSAGSGSTAGQINLRSDAFFSLVNGYGSIASGTTNQFNLYQTTGAGVFRGAILSLNSITESATRTYTLPNADGTLALSTDLGAYLPLTGGTLTGALNGTSASFTGNLQVGGSAISGNSNSFYNTAAETTVVIKQTSGATNLALSLWNNSTTGDSRFLRFFTEAASTYRGAIQYDRAGDRLGIYGGGSGLFFDGAATFSSSVKINQASSEIQQIINSNSDSNPAITQYQVNSNNGWETGMSNAADGYKYLFSWGPFGTANAKVAITNPGSVGIGTASPQTILDIIGLGVASPTGTGSSNIVALLRDTTAGGINVGAGIGFAGNDGVNTGVTFATINGRKENATSGDFASYLAFQTRSNGGALTERMRITSGGNVDIGSVNSSLGQLNVGRLSAGSTTRALALYNNPSNTVSTGVAIEFYPNTGNDDRCARISSVNTTTVNSSDLRFFTSNDAAPTERMRITSGGFTKITNGVFLNSAGNYHELNSNINNEYAVYVNHVHGTNPQGVFCYFSNAAPNNTNSVFFLGYDTVGTKFEARANGGIANYQANNVNLSDERTKKDIEPLESYWDKFKAIEIVKFKYKDQTHDDFNIGVIAQQVESVAPEFVDVDGWDTKPELDEEGNEIVSEEEPLKSIYTADLHHATIKVLQEAMAKIEELQAQIDSLKNQMQ